MSEVAYDVKVLLIEERTIRITTADVLQLETLSMEKAREGASAAAQVRVMEIAFAPAAELAQAA